MKITINFDTEITPFNPKPFEDLSINIRRLYGTLNKEKATKLKALDEAMDTESKTYTAFEKADTSVETPLEIVNALSDEYENAFKQRIHLEDEVEYLERAIYELMKASEQLHYYSVETE